MAEIRIRNEYGHEFTVDATARPFWVDKPGCLILDDQPDADAPDALSAASAAPDQPEVPGTSRPQRGEKKG
ncbi:hypothetical protein AB0F17_08300 [Nonomuraea sp. NPDC026600]|uniref:hypothetical protein n=1 Tax=Nonomuraea sp. NPDC026600 TaxID=3155363 RepID=UPI0033D274CC